MHDYGGFALIGGLGRPFRADDIWGQTQGVALGWYEAAPLALVMVAFGFFIVCLDEARLALIGGRRHNDAVRQVSGTLSLTCFLPPRRGFLPGTRSDIRLPVRPIQRLDSTIWRLP